MTLVAPIAPSTPEDVSAVNLLGISASLKPAPSIASTSASRNVLVTALRGISAVFPHTLMLDLREHELPFFDGRMASERPEPSVHFALECVHRAGSLLFSIPAYWCGVSGVFKNFVDVLFGPSYEMEGSTTVFTGKPIGAIVVGADEPSARFGSDQAAEILASTGARLVDAPIAIANPRLARPDEKQLWDRIAGLCATIARDTLISAEAGAR